MVRCRLCGALNADHVEHCAKCDAKLQTQDLIGKGLQENYNDSNIFGMITAFFSIIMGLVFLIVELIAGTFSIIGLFYFMLGIAIITIITKSLEDSRHIKNLEIEMSGIKKQLNAIKEEMKEK
jgi:hypothetical protein